MSFILLILFLFLIVIYKLSYLQTEVAFFYGPGNSNLTLEFYVSFMSGKKVLKFPLFCITIFSFLEKFTAELESFLFWFYPGKNSLIIDYTYDFTPRKVKDVKKKYPDPQQCHILSGLKIYCPRFYLTLDYGFENPAFTGLSYGLFWSIREIIFRDLKSKVNFTEKPQIYVSPDFNQQKLEMKFRGIFAVRIGNIIITGLKLLIYYFKGGMIFGRKYN